MPREKPLSDVVSVLPRFRRSSSVARDWERMESIDGYILTPIGRSIIQRIAASLDTSASTRSWSLTGPYGTGKSAFVSFLSHLLASGNSVGNKARDIFRELDTATHSVLFKDRNAIFRKQYLHPVLVSGQFSSLSTNLISALQASINAIQKKNAKQRKFLLTIDEFLEKSHRESRSVVHVFEEALKLFDGDGSTCGLLLVIDELGKHLEYAVADTAEGEVFVLQELAELALRSPVPFLILTVLHQSFDRYASHISTRRRTEWAKVQGRYEDIVFEEPTDQVIRLVANVFQQGRTPSEERKLRKIGVTLAEEAWISEFFHGSLSKKEFVTHLSHAYPLHPSVSLLLGPLFRQIAQNERSLFAFICSSEPHGFTTFLHHHPATLEKCASYRPDHLYDYVTTAIGSNLITQYRGKHWAEVQSTVQRLHSASILAVRVAKVIGLLQAIGHSRGCQASRDYLIFALRDENTDADAIDQAIEELEKRSICIFRRHANSYVLWEGSDVDFQTRMEEAKRVVSTQRELTAVLKDIAPVRPIVAKRHSYKTGTLRYIDVTFTNLEDLQTIAGNPLGAADGRLIYCVPLSTNERDEMAQVLGESPVKDIPWLITALPEQTLDLQDVCYEIACLQWVQKNTPELTHDLVASRELRARLNDAEHHLQQLLNGMYAPTNDMNRCRWLHKGKSLRIPSVRALNGQLSMICDDVYRATPIWRNELINRRSLSSSAAAARRNLIEAMLSHQHQEHLGIEGFPPEKSMYESILKASGLHRVVHDELGFHKPSKRDAGMHLVWLAIDRFLEGCDEAPRSLTDLFAMLQAPPFGLKEGILPVLFTCVVLCYEAELALYENQTFVPQMTVPIAERLLRAPGDFSIQRCRIVGPKAYVFSQYSSLLQKPRDASVVNKPTLLGVVRPLLKFAKSLPDYVRNTQQVSKSSKAILAAIETTRNPNELLFRELPVACGCSVISDHTDQDKPEIKQFFDSLRTGLSELQQAYTKLLADVRQQFMDAFSIQGTLEEFRRELFKRSRLVSDIAVDMQLRAFVNRVIDTPGDDDTWIESIAALLANKPATQWNDQDRARFEVNLVLIARTFSHFEALAFEIEGRGAALLDGDDTALRIAVTIPRQREMERVVRIPPRLRQDTESVHQEILKLLRSRNLLDNNEIGAAVLAHIVRDLLKEGLQEGETRISDPKR